MKKFVRTADGKIFDCKQIVQINIGEYGIKNHQGVIAGILIEKNIIKQSDIIEDLIIVGDLVKYKTPTYNFLDLPNGEEILGELADEDALIRQDYNHNGCELLELYTKQGDNYVLVWSKERGMI